MSKARELANLGNAYSDGALSNRNLIINGAMQVAQRGTSTSTINTYLVDRWRSYGGALTHTMSQQDVLSSLGTSKYALRMQRNSGATETNNTGFAQGIESANCYGLAGTTVTLSFKARKGADLSGQFNSRVFFGTGVDQNPVGMTGQTSSSSAQTLSTDWAYFTQIVSVPSGTTQMTVGFDWTPSGTAGTNDWFEISEVQLERGDTATPFEHRSYGQELALCQRYYQQINCGTGIRNVVATGIMYDGDDGLFPITLPVPLRTAPAAGYNNICVFYGDTLTQDTSPTFQTYYSQGAQDVSTVAMMWDTFGGVYTADRNVAVGFNDNVSDGYLAFDSEL